MRRTDILLVLCAFGVLVLLAWAVPRHQMSVQMAHEKTQAQLALLGRWGLASPLPKDERLTLDFHAGTTGRCDFAGPAGAGQVTLSYTLEQVSRRQRVLDLLQHRSVPKPTYLFRGTPMPRGCPLSRFGSVWQGTLLGDGNVLVLSAPATPSLALRRLGAG
jgi:hypothetical protein